MNTQWDGTWKSYKEIIELFPEMENNLISVPAKDKVTLWEIKTLEGKHMVSKGDFIIKGIKGEFYPCKPDIFKLTYESVKLLTP